MNNIKNVFTIRDLENLSGIKAHTIRIWEKRYNVLEPLRTDTNIRYYDVSNLQKLLNISTLNTFGYKISYISKMPAEKIPGLVRDILSNKSLSSHVLNNFKMAMMNFDQKLFLETYSSLLREKTFREIFYDYFIPLLSEIGTLWQTNTITPAHEHFISNLLKQKIYSITEKLLETAPKNEEKTFVLYLPENEIHEIGLMFINYELVAHGYRTVYLGESVPIENLKDIKNYFDNITFVTYITVEPTLEEVGKYIDQLHREVVNDETTSLSILGRNSQFIDKDKLGKNSTIYNSISELTDTFADNY